MIENCNQRRLAMPDEQSAPKYVTAISKFIYAGGALVDALSGKFSESLTKIEKYKQLGKSVNVLA